MTKQQEQWLRALESGDYAQCTSVLKRENKFCCLGVAMELFSSIEDHQTCLSDSITKLLGLRSSLGEFRTPYELNGIRFHSLAQLNDNSFSFAEIAAIIRKYKDEVFVDE